MDIGFYMIGTSAVNEFFLKNFSNPTRVFPVNYATFFRAVILKKPMIILRTTVSRTKMFICNFQFIYGSF